MKKFMVAGAILALLAGCTEPEVVVPEDTGPEIVPLSIKLAD